MNPRLQIACAIAGPVGLVLYAIFFWGIAGFIAPTDPGASAQEIATFYDDNRTEIRVGQIGGLVASTFFFPFFALISFRIAKIERSTWLLAASQFGAAILLMVFFAVCSMLWITASFRTELDPQTVQTLHDLGWLMFVMVFPGYCMQMLCMGIAGFMDKSEHPTWPRWAAYLNCWVALSGAGGGLAVFFKDGPFAWNGVIGFYMPIIIFAGWLCLTTWLLIRSIRAEAAAEERELDRVPGTVGTPA